MLAILFCLAGVFILLVISEILGQKKNLRGDAQRKFVHLTAGSFIAFWPWLISWRAIQIIGVAMLAVVLLNHRVRLIDFHSKINRQSYGDIFFALAVIVLPFFTHQKAFFAIAMLIMSIGDTVANLIGRRYIEHWSYQVFDHNKKTVIGSMALWFTAVCILAGSVFMLSDLVSYASYGLLLLFLPPILVLVENLSVMGLDDLLVPIVTVLALNLAK